MSSVRIDLDKKTIDFFAMDSIKKGFKGKLKPYLEAKLTAEAEGKKIGLKQTKLKL